MVTYEIYRAFLLSPMGRHNVYKQVANELWKYGKTKIGILDINLEMDADTRKEHSIMITLEKLYRASLRDSENSIVSYDEIDDQIAGIYASGSAGQSSEYA